MGPGSNPTRALKNIDDSSRIRNRSPLVAFPRRQHDHHFASSTGSRRPSQSFLTHLAKVPPMDPLFLVSQRSVPRILDILSHLRIDEFSRYCSFETISRLSSDDYREIRLCATKKNTLDERERIFKVQKVQVKPCWKFFSRHGWNVGEIRPQLLASVVRLTDFTVPPFVTAYDCFKISFVS